MIRRLILQLLIGVTVWCLATGAHAINIITPGDPILAIDLDFTIGSDSPENEGAENLLDGESATKYLNFGVTDTGFIVTPDAASTVRSFQLTTANDFPARDPASWILYGTNDAITSAAHSNGRQENWAEISMGDLMLPDDRFTLADPVGFANDTPYSSYKMVFPTVKALANSMQVADVGFFASMDGTGTNLLGPANPIIPIRDADPMPSSNSPAAEGPENAIDLNVNTKYLNFGEERSGFIVTPSIGSSTVSSFQITTANDVPVRDPASWELYGTNDPIVTENNGIGDVENWTLIDTGTLELPDERFTAGPEVAVNNAAGAFTSYRMIFPTVKDEAGANSMQIAEVAFLAPDPATLVVNRATGEVMIRADNDVTFAGYEITSQLSLGLDDTNWTSIASTNADSGDTWAETSEPGSRQNLAESDTPGGDDDGFTLTAGNTYSLGNVWQTLPSTFEDLFFDLRGLAGERIADGVEYVGDVIVLGDYSGNGSVGPEDWPTFAAGYGGNYAGMGMTTAQAYLGGDLDGDFDSDLNDFNLFVAAAGGAGALFGTSNVPEPTSLALVMGCALLGVGMARCRRRGAALSILIGVGLACGYAVPSADAQTFTNVGGVPAATSIPADQMNETDMSGPENFFDDDFLDGAGNLDGELFILDYNDPDLQGGPFLQYAGLGGDPKTVFFDYGSTVNANWFAYSQRSGGDPTADRVGKFEFWFSNTSFNDIVPETVPNAVIDILPTDARLRDSAFRPYSLYGSQSGRYVAMRLSISELSVNQPVSNIGGHEFRLLSGPSDVVLQVDRSDGDMTLMNNLGGATSWDFKSFTIESPSGGLDPEEFDGIGGASGEFPEGDGSGNGWEVGGGSNAARLAEGYFSSSSNLAAGTNGLSLGNGYNELAHAEDLVFTFTNSVGEVYNGLVEYVGVAPEFFIGDYNDDGVVNAGDYVAWRNAVGTNTVLPHDPSPGVVDQFDYDRWVANFGAVAGAGSGSVSASVPEPATGASLTLAVAFALAGWQRPTQQRVSHFNL